MTTIISALIVGAIIGALARLVMPGRQHISLLMTVLLGLIGGLVGSWVTKAAGYHNQSGFAWIPFIVGIIVAVILIGFYTSVTGRRHQV